MGARNSAEIACISALMLASCAACAFAQTPFEFSGALETSVTSLQLPSDDDHETLSQSLASSHLSTYLWEPWIAVVSADLNAAFETDFEGNYADETRLTGDFSLTALPLSRYPFEVFYSAFDSRFEGDFSGSDYAGNRAGLSGRAAFNDRLSLDYLVSYDEMDRVNYGDLTAQRADATLRKSFNVGDLPLNVTDAGLTVSYYRTEFDGARGGESDSSGRSLLGSAYYRASPAERLNHDFRTTVISDRANTSQHAFDRLSTQGVGTLQWRSPSNDVTATGAVRVLQQQIDYSFDETSADTDNALMSANAGISWRASDRLTMSLGARANAENLETITNERTGPRLDSTKPDYGGGVLGSIDYRSLSHELAGFDWHWDARADGDVGYRTMYGPRNEAPAGSRRPFYRPVGLPWTSVQSLSLGHSFERLFELPLTSSVSSTFLQEVGFSHESEDEEFQPILTHSMSFASGFDDEMGSSYLRLYLRDTHNLSYEAEEYQTAQVDFTRQMPLGGDRSLRGDLSLQGVRQRIDPSRHLYIWGHEREDYYVSARANLEYEHRDLFGIDGLSFSSELRLNAIGFYDLTHDWQDDLNPDLFRNDWRNRLQYGIGELWLSLEGTLYEEDGEFGHYVRFSGRRSFDTEY